MAPFLRPVINRLTPGADRTESHTVSLPEGTVRTYRVPRHARTARLEFSSFIRYSTESATLTSSNGIPFTFVGTTGVRIVDVAGADNLQLLGDLYSVISSNLIGSGVSSVGIRTNAVSFTFTSTRTGRYTLDGSVPSSTNGIAITGGSTTASIPIASLTASNRRVQFFSTSGSGGLFRANITLGATSGSVRFSFPDLGHATTYQLSLGTNQGANVARSVLIPPGARKARIGVSKNVRYFFGNPVYNLLPSGYPLATGTHEIDVGEGAVLSMYKEDSTNAAASAYTEFYGRDENTVRCIGDTQFLVPSSGVVDLTGDEDEQMTVTPAPNVVHSYRIPTNTTSIELTLNEADLRYTLDGTDPADGVGTYYNFSEGTITIAPQSHNTLKIFQDALNTITIKFVRHSRIRQATNLLVNSQTSPFVFTTDGSDPGPGRGIYVDAGTPTMIPCYKGDVKAMDASLPVPGANGMQWQPFEDHEFGGNVYEGNVWRPLGGEYEDDFGTNATQFRVPGNAKWAWIGARIPFVPPATVPPTVNDAVLKISTNGLEPSGASHGTNGYLLNHSQSIKIPVPAGTDDLRIRGLHAEATATIMYFG